MILDVYKKKHAGQEEEMSLQMWSDFHNKEVGIFLCPDLREVWPPAVSKGNQCVKN